MGAEEKMHHEKEQKSPEMLISLILEEGFPSDEREQGALPQVKSSIG